MGQIWVSEKKRKKHSVEGASQPHNGGNGTFSATELKRFLCSAVEEQEWEGNGRNGKEMEGMEGKDRIGRYTHLLAREYMRSGYSGNKTEW
jgi:hypothetical protein